MKTLMWTLPYENIYTPEKAIKTVTLNHDF